MLQIFSQVNGITHVSTKNDSLQVHVLHVSLHIFAQRRSEQRNAKYHAHKLRPHLTKQFYRFTL